MIIIEDRVTSNRERVQLNSIEMKRLDRLVNDAFTLEDADRLESRLILLIDRKIIEHMEESPNE